MEKRKERRAYPRFKCKVPVVVFGGKPLRLSSALMLNFSDGGSYFEISEPLQTGDSLVIKIDDNSIIDPVSSGSREQRSAEVRWSMEIGEDNARRYGCGIAYINEE